MFLKKLYTYNKKLFSLFVCFILSFVFINYKWGLTIAPIMQFGMYSKLVKITDTVIVYKIEANKNLVIFSNYNLFKRDVLELPLYYKQNESENNKTIYTTLKKVASKLNLNKKTNEFSFTNNYTLLKFNNWYTLKLTTILKTKIDSVNVTTQTYNWKNLKLTAIN